jgi:hypothetical protein
MRELLPYLVAGQALTVLLLVVVILAQLSYRRTLHDILDIIEAARRASVGYVRNEDTKKLRKVEP